ncbi:MAG: glutamyl-tRNA reductase [Woeseiaceae bacterium]|nr:glutamyl-tRNA reductase [Woeseiaceae bacterium]
MPLKILGLNHNTAPVEVREQVVFAGDELPAALKDVRQLEGVEEAVLLSTCNRTEFYIVADEAGSDRLQAWLTDSRGLGDVVRQSLFRKQGDDAIRHLFRVACGLDSMVLGEPQILGQLKDAYREAQSAGTTGSALTQVFQHSFSAAKKVRTDTEIGSSPVSVAYAAVDLAKQFFAGFEKHTALLIGAGVTVELVARHLRSKNIGRLFVANRSLERARALAHEFDGYALPLSELRGTLPEADIVITSTASPEPILTRADMKAAVKARKRRPIVAVDIAVPRDIEPSVSKLDDVYLFTIDDLDNMITESIGARAQAAIDADRILGDELARYLSVQRAKQVAPIITSLRDHAESIREEVMLQARRRLAQGVSEGEIVEYATAAVMKKLLHNPSVRLREAAESSDEALIKSAQTLFGIDKDGDGE